MFFRASEDVTVSDRNERRRAADSHTHLAREGANGAVRAHAHPRGAGMGHRMDGRTDNPCDRLLPLLGPQHDIVQHRKTLLHREVPVFDVVLLEGTHLLWSGRDPGWRGCSCRGTKASVLCLPRARTH